MDGGGGGAAAAAAAGEVVKSSLYVLLGPQQVHVTCPLGFPTPLFTSNFFSMKQAYLTRLTVRSIHIYAHFTMNIMLLIN